MNSNWRKQSSELCTGTGSAWSSEKPILLAVLLSASLIGCGTPSGGVVIDPRLTAPCEIPELRGDTNRDVWVLAVEQKAELEAVCRRMDAVRGLTR